MASVWHPEQDRQMRDMFLFSEANCQDDDIPEPPPPTLFEWNARMGVTHNLSIFDVHTPEQDVTMLSCGRGRGGLSKMYNPGNPVKNNREDEKTVYKYIREVSGLGYSNELIEKSFRKTTPQPIDEEFCDIPEQDNIKYSYSIRNTPETEKITRTSTPERIPHSLSSFDNSSTVSSVTSSPVLVEEKTVESHPPPLSVILNRAKKKVLPKDCASKEHSTRELSLNPSATEFKLNPETPEFKLNPDAPEFKVTHESLEIDKENTGSSSTYCDILVTKPPISSLHQCSNNQIKTNGIDLSSCSSGGEELSWRRRDNNQHETSPRQNVKRSRDFSRNERSYDFLNDRERNSEGYLSWRIRCDKPFDLKSTDDFPAL